VRPLAPSRVDACNPLLQAHPTWARDKHEGRGISTSHGRLPPSRSISRRPIWVGARGDNLLVGLGTPGFRNADKIYSRSTPTIHINGRAKNCFVLYIVDFKIGSEIASGIDDGDSLNTPKNRHRCKITSRQALHAY
jgi:hypothetical protein